MPTDAEAKQRTRQSIAFFAHPDSDLMVSCIDGSNKYPPVSVAEDLARRIGEFVNNAFSLIITLSSSNLQNLISWRHAVQRRSHYTLLIISINDKHNIFWL